MNRADRVAPIGGVEGVGPRWLEFGAGEGAFTLALPTFPGARSSGRAVEVVAIDRDGQALEIATAAVDHLDPAVTSRRSAPTFPSALPLRTFDGGLEANSLEPGERRARRTASSPASPAIVESGALSAIVQAPPGPVLHSRPHGGDREE